jgi:predicted RNA-binding Zn-ribbon protein involved in translation (DUF1610 family)
MASASGGESGEGAFYHAAIRCHTISSRQGGGFAASGQAQESGCLRGNARGGPCRHPDRLVSPGGFHGSEGFLMPIIIWGSRGLTSTLDSGQFYCPKCDGRRDYHLRQVREFFTLYFIPLIPMGRAQRYVECGSCGGTFKEEVLEMEEPTEAQRALRQIYEEMQQGVSIEECQKRLMELGMEANQAESISEEMAGQTWRCETCGDHYLAAVKRCSRCRP